MRELGAMWTPCGFAIGLPLACAPLGIADQADTLSTLLVDVERTLRVGMPVKALVRVAPSIGSAVLSPVERIGDVGVVAKV